ncbi:MAG: hypothetical protein WC773_00450 [Patescibacteria group bacterium]
MEFDASYKRAKRLLGQNFRAMCREAHALAAMGLPIAVYQDHVVLLPTYGTTNDFFYLMAEGIEHWYVRFWCCNAEPEFGQTDYHESQQIGSGSLELVARWFREQLEARGCQAAQLEKLAAVMAAILPEAASVAAPTDLEPPRFTLGDQLREMETGK